MTAIDFSEGILQRLQERARIEGVSLELVVYASWDEVDLDAEGFGKNFDLVIASMTPAVRTPEDLRMMLSVSRGVCYYSGWVQRRWDHAYYELLQLLFNDEFKEGTHGFYLPFMYLYLQGFRPEVSLSQDEWISQETIEEAVETAAGFSALPDL